MTKLISTCLANTLETLWYLVKHSYKRIRKCAAVKNDKRIMALTADELVAKEACYHKRCYSVYTISLYNEQREWQPEGESFSDMAINCLREMLAELYESPDVAEFKTLIDVDEKHLVSRDVDKSEIFQTKKNLRRKIETNIQRFQFLNVHEKLLIYPESLIIEEVIKKYYEVKVELDAVKASSQNKTVLYSRPWLDIVFDVYRNMSIKNAERMRRRKSTPTFQTIVTTQKIKQWHTFLSSASKKTALIKFLVEQWQLPKFNNMLQGKNIFITCGSTCL